MGPVRGVVEHGDQPQAMRLAALDDGVPRGPVVRAALRLDLRPGKALSHPDEPAFLYLCQDAVQLFRGKLVQFDVYANLVQIGQRVSEGGGGRG